MAQVVTYELKLSVFHKLPLLILVFAVKYDEFKLASFLLFTVPSIVIMAMCFKH